MFPTLAEATMRLRQSSLVHSAFHTIKHRGYYHPSQMSPAALSYLQASSSFNMGECGCSDADS